MKYSEFLPKLIYLTKRNDILQTEIGDVIGLDRSTINKRAKRDSKFSEDEIKKLENYFNVSFSDIEIIQNSEPQEEIKRIIPDNYAAFWLHKWGERLDDLRKFLGYSNETMADIMKISVPRYLELVTKSPFPKEKEANAIKDNFSGFTLDELFYDDKKTFYKKLAQKSDKIEIDLQTLSPEKALQLKNLLKEI